MPTLETILACNRFGLGVGRGDIERAQTDPRRFLLGQIAPDHALLRSGDLLSSAQIISETDMASGANALARRARDIISRESAERLRHGAQCETSFAERWARFWCNHFTVSARSVQLSSIAGAYEREAVRPHVFGSFSDLLKSATLHAGMLIYLDASRSIGPNSPAGRRRSAGINENLARECLELHTMGAGSGYAQQDIIELAKALTGWMVATPQLLRNPPGGRSGRAASYRVLERNAGQAVFIRAAHEPGARHILQTTYPDNGEDQAIAILEDIARRPETAAFIARKISRHFFHPDDAPRIAPQLAGLFTSAGGDLSRLARAVVMSEAAWRPDPIRMKAPEDFITSVARALGPRSVMRRDLQMGAIAMGQQPYRAPSPAGWPDTDADWSGPDALLKRIEWANAVAQRAPVTDPVSFLSDHLGETLSPRTARTIAGAATTTQGLTLGLMCPEFQRR
jgi:uncharacterized protein (DUF1800 family)